MSFLFTDPDLIELDRIWPIGQMLNVPKNGTIVVAGAYRGRYIHYLSKRFPTAQIDGFEPQVEYADEMARRFDSNRNIVIRPVALGTGNRKVPLAKSGTDGASLVLGQDQGLMCQVVDAVEALSSLQHIDLFVMNMEGSEWALLPYLMDELLCSRIDYFAIQFHVECVSLLRAGYVLAIFEDVYETVYDNYPTWSYYKRRSLPTNQP